MYRLVYSNSIFSLFRLGCYRWGIICLLPWRNLDPLRSLIVIMLTSLSIFISWDISVHMDSMLGIDGSVVPLSHSSNPLLDEGW